MCEESKKTRERKQKRWDYILEWNFQLLFESHFQIKNCYTLEVALHKYLTIQP